jgi:hypothetical protein
MDYKMIFDNFLLLGLIALIVVGIVEDYWTTSGEYLGFVDEGSRVGLWRLCQKISNNSEIPTVCANQPKKQPGIIALNASRACVCIGSGLFVLGYLIGITSDSLILSGVLSMIGAIAIFAGLVVWKYVYIADFPESELKYGWNGPCYNIMIAVGVLGVAHGLMQFYSYYKL